MNELIERLQARAFNMGTRHVVYDELTVNLLKEAADTLLALQAQLERAQGTVPSNLTEQMLREALREALAKLERVEREKMAMDAALRRSLNWLSSYPGGGALGAYDQARAALPSAKTAQTEQQKG